MTPSQKTMTQAQRAMTTTTATLSLDSAQIQLQSLLQNLLPRAVAYVEENNKENTRIPKGVYVHGAVGTGKTMLVDMFHTKLLNSTRRHDLIRRVHFHDFTNMVQGRIHVERSAAIALKKPISSLDATSNVADMLALEARVYVLDDLFISDAADAMTTMPLLTGMLRPRHRHGVILVTTSNSSPTDLARGLENIYEEFQHEFVTNVLLKHVRVFDMASKYDYRTRHHHQEDAKNTCNNVMVSPDPVKMCETLLANYEIHAMDISSAFGRSLHVDRVWQSSSGTCAAVDFERLCGHSLPALGPGDYAALCNQFHKLIVVNVPQVHPSHFGRVGDASRRFATFLDVAYDRRTIVVVTSMVPDIFSMGGGDDDTVIANHNNGQEEPTTGRWSSDQAGFKPESAIERASLAAFQRASSRWNEMSHGVSRR